MLVCLVEPATDAVGAIVLLAVMYVVTFTPSSLLRPLTTDPLTQITGSPGHITHINCFIVRILASFSIT